jgi:hypothetical protein
MRKLDGRKNKLTDLELKTIETEVKEEMKISRVIVSQGERLLRTECFEPRNSSSASGKECDCVSAREH